MGSCSNVAGRDERILWYTDTVACAILITTRRGRGLQNFLSTSTPKKNPQRGRAKSSALINKTLELHTMVPTVSRLARILITHTRSGSSILCLRPFLPRPSRVRSEVRELAAARTREIATLRLCLSTSLSLSIPSLLPLRAGETRALQPNKGNLRRHPLPVPLLPSSLVCTVSAVIHWFTECVYISRRYAFKLVRGCVCFSIVECNLSNYCSCLRINYYLELLRGHARELCLLCEIVRAKLRAYIAPIIRL